METIEIFFPVTAINTKNKKFYIEEKYPISKFLTFHCQ